MIAQRMQRPYLRLWLGFLGTLTHIRHLRFMADKQLGCACWHPRLLFSLAAKYLWCPVHYRQLLLSKIHGDIRRGRLVLMMIAQQIQRPILHI
ncbi:hypothetical protein N7471_005362 [Penicillium samsonianum]|uniref:uncharacterized protein n=1 Tax=Penicillium samsonianum TaxID=1882272 RepID=UPI002546E826|nr:uncharacterized protein N7471_005362 [Penicillium samsonianum]KAJ6138876.1 hypothetical protein N7471_005362 [Penicillium samsonianum]